MRAALLLLLALACLPPSARGGWPANFAMATTYGSLDGTPVTARVVADALGGTYTLAGHGGKVGTLRRLPVTPIAGTLKSSDKVEMRWDYDTVHFGYVVWDRPQGRVVTGYYGKFELAPDGKTLLRGPVLGRWDGLLDLPVPAPAPNPGGR